MVLARPRQHTGSLFFRAWAPADTYLRVRLQDGVGLAALRDARPRHFLHALHVRREVGLQRGVDGRVVDRDQVGDFGRPRQRYAHGRFGAHAVPDQRAVLQLVRLQEEPHILRQVLVVVDGGVWRVAVVAEVLRDCEAYVYAADGLRGLRTSAYTGRLRSRARTLVRL